MSSKQLDSILSKVPAATIYDEEKTVATKIIKEEVTVEETTRIVATIPKQLKEEIQLYIKNNPGETERIVLLKALKKMGFNVHPSWIVDKRTLR